MKAFFKLTLLLFFVFFIVLIGSELLRWNNFKEMIYKELQIASLDAIEATLDEPLKQDHILYIEDPASTERILRTLIEQNLDLSLTTSSLTRSNHYIHSVRISRLEITQGQYHISSGIPVQDQVPEIVIEGEFDLIPFIARMNDFYFTTKIENRTEAVLVK